MKNINVNKYYYILYIIHQFSVKIYNSLRVINVKFVYKIIIFFYIFFYLYIFYVEFI